MRISCLVAVFLLMAGAAVAQTDEAGRQEQLGQQALRDGQNEEAIRTCESALRLDPSKWECVRVLGLAWERLNFLEEARTNLEAYSSQRQRSGLDPDPETERVLGLVREALQLAAEQSRGTVRASVQVGRRGEAWGLWTVGGGVGGSAVWGRAVDAPGRRVSFGGVYGGGSVLGGGPPGSLLVTPRGLVQVEFQGPAQAGGWARGGVGVTPTRIQQGGKPAVVVVAGIVLAGGLRVQLPGRLRLLIGAEVELLPQLQGVGIGLRADLLAGPR